MNIYQVANLSVLNTSADISLIFWWWMFFLRNFEYNGTWKGSKIWHFLNSWCYSKYKGDGEVLKKNCSHARFDNSLSFAHICLCQWDKSGILSEKGWKMGPNWNRLTIDLESKTTAETQVLTEVLTLLLPRVLSIMAGGEELRRGRGWDEHRRSL